MFGIIGIAFALLIFGISALANLHTAGKYSAEDAKDRIEKAKTVRNASYDSFILHVIAIALLFIF
jgi:hypothetical protein